ncbi:MAG: carbohydrate binding family 9 domain-containing protein, partial [Gemmatimonadetes bacterium]|nr:carbohydrate binding family 9 domain-containing protein [Gemmatimonadota bacterium]
MLLVTREAEGQSASNLQDHLAERPRVEAVRLDAAINLDGVLDEAVWRDAPAATGFRQYQPREGEPASERTEVRFAYDDRALYVGARMYDSLGARGVRTRLVRRDQINGEGDYLQIVFDTFHDHAGRTVFIVNPSGVREDAGQASPGADPAWDPVWQAATRIDSAGWTAEIRIPFDQLRFGRDSAQTWGLQVWRNVDRLGEEDMWAFWSPQESGGPPRFGHLDGLRLHPRAVAMEVTPYLLSRASRIAPTQPGSPFQDPSRVDVRAGADLRMLLGSSLTLSATLNPDFGQVEQDPAVVNLSAFESYFAEKRPFFVEGSGLLFFGGFECWACGGAAGMNVFYSRRIGRAPQGPVPTRFEYAEVPANARLLGAAKLTGRTRGGWQLGFLEAVTSREAARVEDVDTGERGIWPVEPLTNYFLGRVKRTTRGGRATWGVMATSVARRMSGGDSVLAPVLSAHAESLGADWSVATPDQAYRVIGTFVLSNVT